MLGTSCVTAPRVPPRPPESKAYELSADDELLIRHVFGDGLLQEIRPRIYAMDLGDQLYVAAFIPSRDEIWLNSRVRVDSLTLLHEATHYYQKNRLGREMTTHRLYELPSNLSARMDIEQEAMLVMAYAVSTETPPPGSSGCAPNPPSPEETIRYLRTYMHLDLPPPAP